MKKEYYQNHRKEIIKKNIQYNKTHKLQRKIALQKCRKKLRLEVLIHYGGSPPKCACCGEIIIEFLGIDHVHGGGNKHRKQTVRGAGFYLWLKKNGFPKGYQVLCHDCNLSKGFYGYCPHQKEGNIHV